MAFSIYFHSDVADPERKRYHMTWKWPNRLRLSGEGKEGGIQKDLHGILEMLWKSDPGQDLDIT